MPSKKKDKICQICGDKASCFHFNAISCDSCKSFFRRYALKNNQFKCYLGGNCKINVLNRTFCKCCRLKKCFDVGMNSKLILTDEQKTIRKNSIAKQKTEKNTNNYNEKSDVVDSSTGSSSDSSSMGSPESNNSVEIYNPINSLNDFNGLNDFNCLNNPFVKSEDSLTENAFPINIEISYKISNIIPIDRPMSDSENFNELEGYRLTELLNAMQCLHNPYVEPTSFVNKFKEGILTFRSKCDYEVRGIVKMFKKLNSFKTFNESDQMVLIKHASIEIVFLRMVLDYNFNNNCWNAITDKGATLVDLSSWSKGRCYAFQQEFLHNMGSLWNSDPFIIDLLTPIILFNPNRPKLIYKDLVKLEQHIYMHLLQRYLQLRYRMKNISIETLNRLLNCLNELLIIDKLIFESFQRSISKPNPCIPLESPLLREICDRGV